MNQRLNAYFNTYTSTATLAFFRLAFGLMMLMSLIRFVSYGWIDQFYIQPNFHFTYYGFEWVKPLGIYTYLIYLVAGIAAFSVAMGFKYRLSIVTFFLAFTYIELMDKTYYLNHYYFISLVSFVLIFLPANAYFSVDSYRNKDLAFAKIPRWNTDILKVMLAVVYFYAGLAKINSDWLLEAMPLRIWLPTNADLPLIGSFLKETWVAYVFSWFGMIYDLGIVFLLLNKRTRLLGFFFVVVFHVLTRILFPIGVFPYVMIISTLIFFDASFHQKVLFFFSRLFKISIDIWENGKTKIASISNIYKTKLVFLSTFLLLQLLVPFRYLVYPNELFWTEEGFRFSWRVMLMEKAGYTEFQVTDAITRETIHVDNDEFLTRFQEKQMSFQPDFIIQYAHYLHDYYQKQGVNDPIVTVESYVALNGRLSQKYIDPNINLAKEYDTFQHKNWILPFNDTIKGF
ncbi:HTTM domain-containing protein [Flavobacterium antarcticum]|uniref:HTTM domain-containing protein n=1 Tax=Flavobacterium antarcticum TaxID=271155 RepID=UPI0003B73868|nr:HTTM domain-containing protein [Flavobacterium antarcticum]